MAKKEYKYDYLDKELNARDYVTNALRKTNTMFKYHNLPETIPERILEGMLQRNGYVAIAKVADNIYCFNGGLGGEPNVYYEPTICTVANPALNFNADLVIDTDCIIMDNDSYRQGLLPIIERYSAMLVENDISMIMASINTRIAVVFSGGDTATKQSAEEYLRNIIAGKLGVVTDNAFLQSLKINPASTHNNTTISNLIEQNQYIKACLLNEIGLSANTQLKKERLISAEVENNSESLYPIIDDMLNSRRIGVEKINNMFGTDIEVELNSSWDMRAFNGMSIHNTDGEIDLKEIEQNENMDNQETSESDIDNAGGDTTDIKDESNGNNQEVVKDTEDTKDTKDTEDTEDTEDTKDTEDKE